MKIFFKHIRNILIPYHKTITFLKKDTRIKRPIFVFYHIYCGKGNWKSIFNEQVLLMQKSNLEAHVTKFYLTIIGNASDKEYILDKFDKRKISIVYFSQDGSCYEFPCLKKMKSLSTEQNFYALYFHTKGSSYSLDKFGGNIDKFNVWVDNVSAWRDLLNYYNIVKWELAISALNNGFSTYGCLLMEEHKKVRPHYSGNFWWSTSENCKFSRDFDDCTTFDRWNAEQWIINSHSKPYCAFYSYLLLYSYKIQPSTWLKPWWDKENVVYTINHWKEGRKHLLY